MSAPLPNRIAAVARENGDMGSRAWVRHSKHLLGSGFPGRVGDPAHVWRKNAVRDVERRLQQSTWRMRAPHRHHAQFGVHLAAVVDVVEQYASIRGPGERKGIALGGTQKLP